MLKLEKYMEVKIQKLSERFSIPTQASLKAGGWDVVCTKIEKIEDNFVICWLGFALQPPDNYKITLVPRSSLTKTQWVIQNSPGLGDADFLGEFSLRFRCIPHIIKFNGRVVYEPFPYKVGDRVGQMYIEEVIPIEFRLIEELDKTERGIGGFGSTGR